MHYNELCKRNSNGRGDQMATATVNFDYKCGILEGYAMRTGNEFSWYKGDLQLHVFFDGNCLGELSVPAGATAVQVKKLIKESHYV